MPKDFQQWMNEGEEIYNTLLGEHREIESQIEELEETLSTKQSEVNQIAAIIGKAPIENHGRISARLVSAEVVENYNGPALASNNIARALNGRLGR